ncbi:MAG: argininosuccinate lyase [Actinobacteria bacterium]|nr:argininosuccinate lyase [Actinomycetota bacterium]
MPLWSGRFDEAPDPDMAAFTSSSAVDLRLLPYDIAATKAHAHVLNHAGFLDDDELDAIESVLTRLLDEWQNGDVRDTGSDEDVHSLVERVLTEELGEAGRRIHAGRSRNDLVATDLRLWCRDAATEAADALARFIELLSQLAEQHTDTVMPGYTHLQRAQPVSLGFHLLAHGFALVRDAKRFRAAYESADVSTLGAGALAGTTLDLDPYIATQKLDVTRTFDNAMDAVSDRDFVADLVYACALCGVHLSRLAEEVVLWTSSEFGFARLSDSWSTGSSMMPQKRNPDVAELTRGRAAIVIGDLTALLTVLKGLPLAYNRDLQEDKAIVFRAHDATVGCIEAMTALVASITFDPTTMADAAMSGSTWATDLAEVLVTRGVPFRDAHEMVGRLVADLEGTGAAATASWLASHEGFQPEDVFVLDRREVVSRRGSRGGTAPNRVLEQIEQLRAAINDACMRK